MTLLTRIAATAVAVWAAAAVAAASDDPHPRFERVEMDKYKSHFLLEYPVGHDGGRTWPLIVALHGMGDCAEDFFLAWDGIPARRGYLLAVPDGDSRTPCMCGKCSDMVRTWSSKSMDFVKAVIGEAARRGNADPCRVYIAGFSAGACMAFHSGIEYPGLFAAVIPFAGAAPGGLGQERLWKATSLPFLCFVGDRDPGRGMVSRCVDGLTRAGCRNVKLKVVEGLGHDLPAAELPALIDALDRMAATAREKAADLEKAVEEGVKAAAEANWSSAVPAMLGVVEQGVHGKPAVRALEVLWQAETEGRKRLESAKGRLDGEEREQALREIVAVAEEFRGLPCAKAASEALGSGGQQER